MNWYTIDKTILIKNDFILGRPVLLVKMYSILANQVLHIARVTFRLVRHWFDTLEATFIDTI